MSKVKFPENIELVKGLRFGDIKLIAKATGRSYNLVRMIFKGQRRLTPRVESAYRVVVKMNEDMERILLETIEKQPENYNKKHPNFFTKAESI